MLTFFSFLSMFFTSMLLGIIVMILIALVIFLELILTAKKSGENDNAIGALGMAAYFLFLPIGLGLGVVIFFSRMIYFFY